MFSFALILSLAQDLMPWPLSAALYYFLKDYNNLVESCIPGLFQSEFSKLLSTFQVKSVLGKKKKKFTCARALSRNVTPFHVTYVMLEV